MNLFEQHAHYDDEKFDEDREKIIEEIFKFGVKKIISAGYSLESSKKAIELSENQDLVECFKVFLEYHLMIYQLTMMNYKHS